MSDAARVIDTHRHLWIRSERRYDWITPEHGILYADFGPSDIAAASTEAGITGTILVQAADTYEDTFYMLSVAAEVDGIDGVVGWVPLDRPGEARAALELYARSPALRGVRALTHGYDDPHWILRDDVTESLRLVSDRGLTLDYVATSHEHREVVPELARRHPDLTIVLDHLASPPIADELWEPWASQIARCAAESNVVMKISGLGTLSGPEWSATEWQPYVDHVLTRFGAARAMLGSDWPVSLLAGGFAATWEALRGTLAGLREDQRDEVLHRTAVRVYALGRP